MQGVPYSVAQSMQYGVPQSMQYGVPQPMVQQVPMMQQQLPMGYDPYYFSIPNRVRRFFGFAPKTHHFRYKSDRGMWGFMGYSRRQRYMDPRTGWEVDRQGRPVVRVN